MDWKLLVQASAPRRRSSTPGAARLGVERLEDRTLPSVFNPAQIEAAYGFNDIGFPTSSGTVAGTGAGQTIAIVDAYSDPNITSDLATFDRTFGLPAPPSFTVVQQSGTVASTAWAEEIALDVEWAHALAPDARIILGEARSASLSDLVGEADTVAAMPGVSVVSMSWSAPEFSVEANFDYAFLTPAGHEGVTFVAAAGDGGAGASWPANSPFVLSVGGTSLNTTSTGGYGGETTWSGSGGGASAYEVKPAYQNFLNTGVSTESSPDVAFDANPATALYVYNSYGSSGWSEEGGTSAGAPAWAALIAIADQGRVLEKKTTLDGASQTLYALYRMAEYDSTIYFHTAASVNGTVNQPGYNPQVGLGSPNAYMVAAGLAAWNGEWTTGTFGAVNLSSAGLDAFTQAEVQTNSISSQAKKDAITSPVAPPDWMDQLPASSQTNSSPLAHKDEATPVPAAVDNLTATVYLTTASQPQFAPSSSHDSGPDDRLYASSADSPALDDSDDV